MELIEIQISTDLLWMEAEKQSLEYIEKEALFSFYRIFDHQYIIGILEETIIDSLSKNFT